MSKINTNSNKISKAVRIQPALRLNDTYKWRQRLKPVFPKSPDIKFVFFKLKNNYDISLLTNNGLVSGLHGGLVHGTNFNNIQFNFNKKRHQPGNSNQG